MSKFRSPPTWLLLVLLFTLSFSALTGIFLVRDSVRTEAREQFFELYNQQQYLHAEQSAHMLENFFTTLKRSLGLVASLFENTPVDSARAEVVQGSLYRLSESLADSAVIDLVVFDREGAVISIHPQDAYTLGRNYAWRGYFRWARDEGQPGEMYLSPFERLEGGQHRGDKAFFVAQGLYGADGAFKGVAMFTVNFDELAREHVLSVRMGEHGYAWLADFNNRTVLVDPHGAAGGYSFEEAFLPAWPELYSLLTSVTDGQGGTGSYRYEDPVDPSQGVRKLVGYQPVLIEDRIWVLGVATPEREVDALLSSFLKRQETFSLTLAISILSGTAVVCALLLAWNRMLSRRVELRTRDLDAARVQLEETFDELLASKKLAAVGHMALGLAHEIRNPLSAIRMNIQMIRKRQPEAPLQEHFEIVESEILRLNRLLNDVMDFARPRPLRLEATDPRELVRRVLRLLGPRLVEAEIQVELDLEVPPAVRWDPEQIEQVLLNLALNAVEAMEALPPEASDAPRRLSIRATSEDGWVTLTVSDTGCGIDPRDQDKLFDPFFTTKSAGGGLGLSTLQHILLRHRGTVEVQSRPGLGASFIIRLPVTVPVSTDPQEPPRSPAADGITETESKPPHGSLS